MHPELGSYPAYVVGWALGSLLGGGSAVWLMYRAGFSDRQVAVAFYSCLLALLVGSKLMYLLEAWPHWVTDRQAVVAALFSEQMRLPGGILLALAWSMAPPVLIEERRPLGACFGRSAELTRGSRLYIFGLALMTIASLRFRKRLD